MIFLHAVLRQRLWQARLPRGTLGGNKYCFNPFPKSYILGLDTSISPHIVLILICWASQLRSVRKRLALWYGLSGMNSPLFCRKIPKFLAVLFADLQHDCQKLDMKICWLATSRSLTCQQTSPWPTWMLAFVNLILACLLVTSLRP